MAQRVGVSCSSPTCRKPTSGPHEEANSAVNIGVASHITAAAPGGPRYDESLTPAERRSIENGIWLCQNCAKLVDNDPNSYTVKILKGWKEGAERAARIEVETSSGGSQFSAPTESESPSPSQARIVPTKEGSPSFLARLTSGDELTAVVNGACSSSFDHDKLETKEEVDAVAGILQLTQDWADISSDLEIGDKVRMGVDLTRSIEELAEKGFWIFGAREMRQLEGGIGSPEPWPVAHIRVARKDNETIVKFPFGTADSGTETKMEKQEEERQSKRSGDPL